jgi:hypothetical protein
MSSFDSLIVFSGISFILYGILAFITEQSQKEFVRWGFEKQRILIGSTQLVGGAGLIMGLQWPVLGLFASGGLAILMFFGCWFVSKSKILFFKCSPLFCFSCSIRFFFTSIWFRANKKRGVVS